MAIQVQVSQKLPRQFIFFLTAAVVVTGLLMLGGVAKRKRSATHITTSNIEVVDHTRTKPNSNKLEKICFTRGGWIYVHDLTTRSEIRLIQGSSPHISPRGDAIAFLSNTDSISPPSAVQILDIKTRHVRILGAAAGSSLGDPLWSNDGTRIAVIAATVKQPPSILVLDAIQGTIQQRFSEGWDALGTNEGIFLSSWMPDDAAIIFHTLTGLYEARIDTRIVAKVPATGIFGGGGISSASQFSFSDDRRYLLFNKMIDTPDEPATSAIFLFDISKQATRRVSPKGISSTNPIWLPSRDAILFTRTDWVNDRWRPSICRLTLDGSSLETLLDDADWASFSVSEDSHR